MFHLHIHISFLMRLHTHLCMNTLEKQHDGYFFFLSPLTAFQPTWTDLVSLGDLSFEEGMGEDLR